ncbi:EndoU domain-containing protein, partial [Acinetobacter sp. ANC 4639]
LIQRGVEPKEIDKLFDNSKAGLLTILEILNVTNKRLESLKSQGLTLNQILSTEVWKATEDNIISFKDYNVEVMTKKTLGMSLLSTVNFLGNSIAAISKETGVDPETVQLAVGLLLSGPVKLVGDLAMSSLVDAAIGDQIKEAKNNLAISMTAAARLSSSDTVNKFLNPESISEVDPSKRDDFEDIANGMVDEKQGAEYLIDVAAGIIGVGVGKGVAKGNVEEINLGLNQKVNEEISALNKIKENNKGTNLSTKLPDTIINQQASKQVDKVTAPIDIDNHILNTEINSRGRLTGGHSIADGNVNIVSKGTPNAQGVYEAKISVPDPKNPNKTLTKTSTMFPDSWSADRIKVEVDAAYKSKSIVTNSRGQSMWEGTTPSGVKVTGYLEPNTTVYPLIK